MKKKAKQFRFIETAFLLGGWGKYWTFHSQLRPSQQRKQNWTWSVQDGGQICSHKKGSSRERDWLELETSGELGSLLLGRWEGNPHGMAFPGNSFPFMLGHSFSPASSRSPSHTGGSHQPTFHSFLSLLAFPLHPGPVPGRCNTQPLWSLPFGYSPHLARRELPTLDQMRWRSWSCWAQ